MLQGPTLTASLRTLLAVAALATATAAAPQEKPKIELDTSEGKIVLELDPAKAPKTVENFLKYVEEGHYNNTVFHRVIKDFMIQGGGFSTALEEKKTRDPVENESKAKNPQALVNTRGSIAMARTSDPNSATAQFFINHKDNPPLDSYGGGYTVFGKVVSGMEVLDKIANTPTEDKQVKVLPNKKNATTLESTVFQNVPVKNVVLNTAKKL